MAEIVGTLLIDCSTGLPRGAEVYCVILRRCPPDSPSNRRGFTLIELLVVILIIGTLMGIAIPLYLSSVRSASAQAIKANLRMIGQAGQVYYVKNNRYPSTIGDLVGAGRDIANVSGPRGVVYDIDESSSPGGPFVVKAMEHGLDVFGSPGAADSATFTLSSNIYNGL